MRARRATRPLAAVAQLLALRSEEHTSELQSHSDLVCRLLLEKKKKTSAPSALAAGLALSLERALDEVFFLNDTATTEIYTLSLHDALPISPSSWRQPAPYLRSISGSSALPAWTRTLCQRSVRSEEHTSELQSHSDLVC